MELLSSIVDEARLAIRLWLRQPGLTSLAVTTIALGIGAPTAVFSVVHAVLLRPLPYFEPERVVSFRMESQGPQGVAQFDALPVSGVQQWMLTSKTLAGISVYNERALTLSTENGPFRLSGVTLTPNAFSVLGVGATLGRTFEETTTDRRQIVLSYDTWQRFFGGRATIIGSSAMLDGEPYLVIGVMPAQFDFPTTEAAFWAPLLMDPSGGRGMVLPTIARLRPEANLAAVEAEARRLFEDGRDGQTTVVRARTLHEQLVATNQRMLWTLMAAVIIVSTVATANIALLLLVRGAARAREFAIRLMTGAPRARIVRQLLVETSALATIGGVAGVALAALLVRVLLQSAPPDMPRVADAAIDAPVLLFATVLTALSALVVSVFSAGAIVTADPVRALTKANAESRLSAVGVPRRRLNTLAAMELALTLVLLVGAGLLLRSVIALLQVDHGFNPSGALALQVSMPVTRYPTPADRMAFQALLLERVAKIPAVQAAGLAVTMPNRQPTARIAYDPVGAPLLEDPSTLQVAEVRTVSDGFFEAMGIPLRAGRTFSEEDRAGADPVMVISERLARLHFSAKDPIGRLLYSGSGPRRVVGVVGDVKPAARGAVEPGPAAYLPMRQDLGVFRWFAGLTVVVRGPDPEALKPALRTAVISLDPDMPPFNVRTLEEETTRLVAGPRFSASALAAFAVTALVLAAIGVYGVMACTARLRTREFGVRVALGATRAQLLRLVMREGVIVIATGLAIGMTGALWLARAITGLLYQVQPADHVALTAVAALLGAVSLLAVFVPAHRATRVSALEALRSE